MKKIIPKKFFDEKLRLLCSTSGLEISAKRWRAMEVFKLAEENHIITLEASKSLAEQRFLKGGCDRPLVKNEERG